MRIRIGTRPSALALIQAHEAMGILKKIYPDASCRISRISTVGDRDKITPISEVEQTDFFTRELDEALLEGRIDIAVHSSKDLPDPLPKGLIVALETPSISHNDALVSSNGLGFFAQPKDSRIGASSERRKRDILNLRKDLKIISVRGTIEERLHLVDSGKVDALVVAYAALIRLGRTDRATEILPLELFKTHPKQGGLSLVVKKDGRYAQTGI